MRDQVWDKLIECGISELPVQISKICQNDGIHIYSFRQAKDLIDAYGLSHNTHNNDGFAVILRGEKFIFFDDENCSVQRQRFTVGHEYGHFLNDDPQELKPTLRNHEPAEQDDNIETNANIVASRILSPACVLWGLKVQDVTAIARLCNISDQSAEWRWKRLEDLYKREQEFLKQRGRSCFLLSKKEQKVFDQFQPYIQAHLNSVL